MAQSDSELIRAVLDRDEEAFAEILRRHGEAVHRRIARMLRDETVADDLTQEVFLRIWKRAGQWRGRGTLRAWLMSIATNLALNHFRSARAHGRRLEMPPTVDDEDEEAEVPGWMIDAATPGPSDAVEQSELRDRLRALMLGLSEEKREVLEMVYGENMDVATVAEALGIPEGTVKSRLHRARMQLTHIVKRHMDG